MNSKIKLMVVTPYFYPKIGGLENYALNISKQLIKDYNYEVVVVTSNHESKNYLEEELEGIKIYRLPPQFKISNTPISFKWSQEISRIIDIEKPDIINAHSPVPFISDIACRVANKKDIPFVLTYHSGSMIKDKAFLKNLIISIYENYFLKKTLKLSKKIISCSDFVRNEFLDTWKDKTITITPGVDTKLFKPSEKKAEENTIVFIGNFSSNYKWKGLDYLIEAIKLLDNLKLKIIGEGEKNNLENIEYLGILKQEDIVKEINKSQILVLPSITNSESFGMVLIEAMACKKPVIGSNIGGIPYVIDDGKNGLLVKSKNAKELSKAIKKLLENPDMAKKLGENGHKKVMKEYTWEMITLKYNNLFEEI